MAYNTSRLGGLGDPFAPTVCRTEKYPIWGHDWTGKRKIVGWGCKDEPTPTVVPKPAVSEPPIPPEERPIIGSIKSSKPVFADNGDTGAQIVDSGQAQIVEDSPPQVFVDEAGQLVNASGEFVDEAGRPVEAGSVPNIFETAFESDGPMKWVLLGLGGLVFLHSLKYLK
jgi:hypothetical protein